MSTLASAVLAAVAGTAVREGFGPVTVDVPRERWTEGLAAAHAAGATFFDLLTAYDDGPAGFAVVVHLATPDLREHVLVRTALTGADHSVDTATGVYRGAAWHERETHEMFGIDFLGNGRLDPLLLRADLGAAPLRKDFVLAARAARPWPGEKDPADQGGRPRRRTVPPGVPTDWPEAGA